MKPTDLLIAGIMFILFMVFPLWIVHDIHEEWRGITAGMIWGIGITNGIRTVFDVLRAKE